MNIIGNRLKARSARMQCSAQPGVIKRTWVYHGPYTVLAADLEKMVVGRPFTREDGQTVFLSGGELSADEPGHGLLTVTGASVQRVEYWSLDFEEISKDIRAWKAGANDAPDLAQLRRWEALEGEFPAAYADYAYEVEEDGSTKSALTGNTLKLAQMILEKGYTSFTVHAPVITRATYWDSFPVGMGASLDRVVTPGVRSGWVMAGNNVSVASFTGLKAMWMNTTDRCAVNPDGIFERTEQWLGADDFDPDLYAS